MITLSAPSSPADPPATFPSPFDRSAVHPLARQAALDMLAELRSPGAAAWQLDAPGNGKMFGVLVVQHDDGRIGYLRAFSGMLGGEWFVEGWAPPTFDTVERDLVWRSGEREMRELAAERAALTERAGSATDEEALIALDRRRSARSRELLPLIQDTYRFANAIGESRGLRQIFAPAEPPGGAGDCAAPKLLAHAYRLALRPIALAELWCGAPPRSGDRRDGAFYPACHGKCGPILAHMLRGLRADPAPEFGAAVFPASEPPVVYEDEYLVVVDKPSGMLSVPGRSLRLQDSVMTRLRDRYPDAPGQLVVHRLDLDTSGLLLAAKDRATFSALQRSFSLRAVTKRYIAWLDGTVAGDQGVIELPIRLDIDDRPRQIHDPEFGKAAVTRWAVLERTAQRTRVELTPLTGRTHQLRVHAAHPLGLDAPIVGDRLYGREAPEEGERLLLHAELLEFLHPVTGAALRIERRAPF
jgi:tRNA pseudouridine32 synthase / 23S rRNA pseudouridine746 synthase